MASLLQAIQPSWEAQNLWLGSGHEYLVGGRRGIGATLACVGSRRCEQRQSPVGKSRRSTSARQFSAAWRNSSTAETINPILINKVTGLLSKRYCPYSIVNVAANIPAMTRDGYQTKLLTQWVRRAIKLPKFTHSTQDHLVGQVPGGLCSTLPSAGRWLIPRNSDQKRAR